MTEIIESNKDYWLAEDVTPYVIDFLMKTFPESIIIREFNKVDITVLDENLAVEIQSSSKRHGWISISEFEDNIRRQIEQNIEIFGKCWLFLDKQLLIYINNSTSKNISVNLDWLYQLWKSEKVKTFTITCDGIIEEMVKDDWNFLSKKSQTCIISSDNDNRVLNRNKSIILCNILKSCGFSTNEINILYNLFLSRNDKKKHDTFKGCLSKSENTNREHLLYEILHGMTVISHLNNFMYGISNDNDVNKYLYNGVVLGLFERNDAHPKSNQMRIHFSDKYNIAKYFPGYIRNKEMWDCLKTRWLNRNEFYGVITGTYTYKLIKQQSMLKDF